MKYCLIIIISLIICVDFIKSQKCKNPQGAEGFVKENYIGKWYEIAKFQTAGGAYFEKNCVCTSIEVAEEKNILKAHNICRNLTPQGKVTEAVGTLTEDQKFPGHFKQKMFWFSSSIDYTIVFQGVFNDEEYSVEYDCHDSFFFGTNYCVHFLSRKPVMSEELLTMLIGKVNELDLNNQNLDLVRTKHEGCWEN